MAKRVQMNEMVLPETKAKVDEIARLTLRNKGTVLDILVDAAYKAEMMKQAPEEGISDWQPESFAARIS